MIEIEMKVGPKGQVVIPKIFRKALKMHPRSDVVFKIEDERLILERPRSDAVKLFREIAQSTPQYKGDMPPHEPHEEELGERLEKRSE